MVYGHRRQLAGRKFPAPANSTAAVINCLLRLMKDIYQKMFLAQYIGGASRAETIAGPVSKAN